MNKKLPLLLGAFLFIGILLVAEFFFIKKFACPEETTSPSNEEEIKEKPKAMMLLIEFKNTDGLINMVNDMKQRDVKGILMANPDFVEKNLDTIKEILKTGNIEIAASYSKEPFWDMPYEDQYTIISDMVTGLEELLDMDVRIVSSKYMASDENTVKVADELGIEYITARGTTELATTVYKPEEYNVKIISVSNIDVPEFKYGSFCDYSFYERNGNPEDMTREFERAIQNEKFIGVSHTYIGGFKARWNDMWHDHWDNYDVDWVDLDTFGTVDKVMPMWQIPVNTNAPYTPEKIRPAIPYEEEEDVNNPCRVDDLNEGADDNTTQVSNSDVVMFHNNTGPMCLDALEYFANNNIDYIEYLTTDDNFNSQLQSYKSKVTESEGVSSNFGYYPIIFVGDKAFSGFNEDVQSQIEMLINN